MMKNTRIFTAALLFTFIATSCDNAEKTVEKEVEKTEIQNPEENEFKPTLTVEMIDKMRSEIEALDMQPIEIGGDKLRAKAAQKWSKVHFYVKDNRVVKIKTYPHEGVSKRTEEFYANENGLVLVVIEDDGSGPKGKAKKDLDKIYYFEGEHLILEVTNNEEEEFQVRNGDAEELLAEYKEYLEVYMSNK